LKRFLNEPIIYFSECGNGHRIRRRGVASDEKFTISHAIAPTECHSKVRRNGWWRDLGMGDGRMGLWSAGGARFTAFPPPPSSEPSTTTITKQTNPAAATTTTRACRNDLRPCVPVSVCLLRATCASDVAMICIEVWHKKQTPQLRGRCQWAKMGKIRLRVPVRGSQVLGGSYALPVFMTHMQMQEGLV